MLKYKQIHYPEVLKTLHSVDTNKLSNNLNLNKKYFTLKYIQDYVAKNIKHTGNINT
jgi:hypothetical protein